MNPVEFFSVCEVARTLWTNELRTRMITKKYVN